jgi:hypothetical protein
MKTRTTGLTLAALGSILLSGCGGASETMMESWEGSSWRDFQRSNSHYRCNPQGGGYVRCTSDNLYIVWEVDSTDRIVSWRKTGINMDE